MSGLTQVRGVKARSDTAELRGRWASDGSGGWTFQVRQPPRIRSTYLCPCTREGAAALTAMAVDVPEH